jgi:hypothetical protein
MNQIATNLATGREFLGRDYFGPVYAQSEFHAGYNLMVGAIIGGDDPGQVLGLVRVADLVRGAEPDQSRGAMAGLLDCLDALQAGDKSLHLVDPAAWPSTAVRALATTGEMRRAMLRATPHGDYAATLALLIAAARAAGPYLKRAEQAAPPAPPSPTPVQVHVELALPPGPLPVAIVSQPATRSVQTVERDADQEIVQTVTTTAQLAAPA